MLGLPVAVVLFLRVVTNDTSSNILGVYPTKSSGPRSVFLKCKARWDLSTCRVIMFVCLRRVRALTDAVCALHFSVGVR